jgi:hypothetical protein
VGPYLWSVAGLIFDICGAFLLAVEAIKLENLRKLKDRYLRNLLISTTSRPWYDPTVKYDFEELRRREFGGRLRLFTFLHYVPGPVLLATVELVGLAYGINPALGVATWIWHRSIIWRVVTIVISCWLLLLIFMGLGEMLHSLFTWTVSSAIKGLEAIDRNTPTGTIGILGFILLFLGFLGQLTGTIVSAH